MPLHPPGGRCGGRPAGPRRPPRAGAGAARRPCRSRTRRATSSTGRSVVSSSNRACSTRCRVSHAPGVSPVSSRNRRVNVRTLIRACAGHRGQVDRLAEPALRPLPGRSGRGPGRRRQRGHDELRLAAVAPRRHDAAAGRVVGHLAAVVAAHDVQAQVDAGPDAGRGEHVAVVDEEHVRVEPHLREVPAEPVGVGPVGRGRPAVEPAHGGQHERAGADRDQPGPRRAPARAPPPPRGVRCGSWRSMSPCTPGITSVSAVVDDLGPVLGQRPEAARCPDRPGRRRARAHLVQPLSGRGPGGAEDLARDAEVERRDAVQGQHDHAMVSWPDSFT